MSDKNTKIKIEFSSWMDKSALEIAATTIKGAVETAVKDGADLYGANLRGADLCYANLEGTDLRRADLRYADLRGVILEGANLYGANLYGAILSSVNLHHADLRGVNLHRADLEYANLGGADLECANLHCANLHRANLEGTNLEDVNLYGVNLHGAILYRAKYNGKELWKVRPVLQLSCCGSVGRTTLVMFYADKSEPTVYCGCFSGTVDEFETKIHERHGGTFYEYEYMAMVEHIRAIRKYQLEAKDGK